MDKKEGKGIFYCFNYGNKYERIWEKKKEKEFIIIIMEINLKDIIGIII
jgi:hypothetical protein